MRDLGHARHWTALLMTAALLLAGARALAESYEVREYTSPMMIETSFVLADHALWSAKQWHSSPDYARISGSICEHVKITRLELNAAPVPKKDDLIKLGIRGKIKNEFGGDKLATLRFEILDGEQVAAAVNIEVEVEDDEERGFKGFAMVPAVAIPADPQTRMRITMAVVKD